MNGNGAPASGAVRQGELRFSVHRHPMYESFWRSTATPDQDLRLEIQIYLETGNMTADAYWIVAAELAGIPAVQTVTPSKC